MRDSHSLDVVGRLRDGATVEQAREEFAAISRALGREYPATDRGWSVKITSLEEVSFGGVRTALLLLSGAVAFVLLIACANVANLFLARAATRQREVAIRSALGASRGRLARQVLVEALTLACVGGLLGLLMASWAIDGLLALEPRGIPRLHEVTLDGRVLAFTLVVSVLVGVAFGLFPAVTVSSQDPADWFRGEGRGSGSRQRSRFRAGLVVTQISLALVLLAPVRRC
jgi:putative ABC transport system permease protein